jgi:hypothetical protein
MNRPSPTTSYPLASLQAAMLVNHLSVPRSAGVDVVQVVVTLAEAVDIARLRAAWELVSERHDVLRTAFRWEGLAEPRQEVYAPAPPPFVELDWTGTSATDVDARVRAFLVEDRRAGFDFRVAPLQRVTFMRIGATDWRMVWTFPHILMDGRSMTIVLRELFLAYDAAVRGETAELPARPRTSRAPRDTGGNGWPGCAGRRRCPRAFPTRTPRRGFADSRSVPSPPARPRRSRRWPVRTD